MAPESASPSAPELSFERQSDALVDLRLDTEAGINHLQYVIDYPPDAPPTGAPDTVQHAYASLVREHELLSKNGDIQSLLSRTKMPLDRRMLLLSILEEFRKNIAAYENECMKVVMPAFLAKLGLGKADPATFDDFRKSLAEPLADVPGKEDARFTDKQREALAAERKELEAVRTGDASTPGLATVIDHQLLGMWMGADDQNSPEDWADHRKTLAIFAARKQRYEKEIQLKKPSSPMWAVFAGMLAEELAEEGLESMQFGKKPSLLRTSTVARLVPGVSAETRIALLQADRKMQQILRMKGISKIPVLGDVLKTVNKTPFGNKMFNQMLQVESPFTVLFYAYYLHSSDNTIKATMNYATFMAGSAASGALLETVELMLKSERVLAMAGPRTASVLSKVAKIPGNPVVKFAAAIGIVYLGSGYIDQFTTWLDEKIPNTPERFRDEMVLTMMSGDALIGDAMFAYNELVPGSVDPARDRFSYLSTELPTITVTGGLDRRFMNDEQAWNDKVRANIADPSVSPVQKKLWALEEIDSTWYPREAAHLYEDVRLLQKMELEIGTELVKRTDKNAKPILNSPRSLNLSEEATEDSDDYPRVDRVVAMALDNQDVPVGRMNTYMKTLPESDTLKSSWKQYTALAKRVAKSVAVYRSLAFADYKRDTWIGKEGKIPDMVENGYAEELAYMLKRRSAYEADAKNPDATHGAQVADLIQTEKDEMNFTIKDNPLTKLQETEDAFIYGDKKLNRRNSLSNTMHAAGSLLPQDKQNDVQRETRDLAASGDVASLDSMRKAQMNAIKTVGEHNDTILEALPAAADVRKALNIADDIPVFLAGNTDSPLIARDLGLAFSESYARAGDTERARSIPRLHSTDIVVCQYLRPDEGGSIVVAMNVIHCHSLEKKNWTVHVYRATLEMTRSNRPRIERKLKEDVPFAVWATRQAALKSPTSALSVAISTQEKSVAKRRSSIRADLPKYEKDKKDYNEKVERAKHSDEFVELYEDDHPAYQRRYGDRIAVHHLKRSGPSISNGRTKEDASFYFELRTDPKIATKPWKIGSIRFMSNEKVSEEDRKIMLDILTSPNETDHKEAIQRILDLCPYRIYDPAGLERLFGAKYANYKEELATTLLPMYEASTKKQEFLRLLVEELAKATVISSTTLKQLPEKMQQLE
jgi:hypothetical protein